MLSGGLLLQEGIHHSLGHTQTLIFGRIRSNSILLGESPDVTIRCNDLRFQGVLYRQLSVDMQLC